MGDRLKGWEENRDDGQSRGDWKGTGGGGERGRQSEERIGVESEEIKDS